MGADVFERARRGGSPVGGRGRGAKVTGLPELIRKLGELKAYSTIESLSFRATYGAAKDLARLVGVFIDATTTARTQALRKSVAFKRHRIGSKLGYTVGIRAGAVKNKKSGLDPYYWWWLEFGTVHIPPKGFFQKAFAMEKGKAQHQIITQGRAAVLQAGNAALRRFGNGKR